MNTPEDDELRALLHNAVSDVQPERGLDAIQQQTQKVTPMKRNWFLATAGVAAAIAIVTGGVAFLNRDQTPTAGPAAGTSNPPTTGSVTPGGNASDPTPAVALPVYYLGDTPHGARLYREFRPSELQDTTATVAALDAALSGGAADPDYHSAWPASTSVNSATYAGDLITIDLHGDVHDRPAGMTQATAALSLQQLIYTAQAVVQKGRPPVQFLIDGKHTDQVLGEASSEPLSAASADSVQSAVWIINPAEGASLNSGFTVSGVAASFEANVPWELKQGDKVVRQGFATAPECCTASPYSFTVDAPPGDYTLVVHDDDPSAGEGPGVTQDTKDITIK
jgi:hypothetical protein